MTHSPDQPTISVTALSKRFGTVQALDRVHLILRRGEVHGIVGENGAGKSTLMKILSGVEQPSEGELQIDGSPVRFHGVSDALKRGIAMIHQELNLVDELSVADNIFLGREFIRFGLIDRSHTEEEARR